MTRPSRVSQRRRRLRRRVVVVAAVEVAVERVRCEPVVGRRSRVSPRTKRSMESSPARWTRNTPPSCLCFYTKFSCSSRILRDRSIRSSVRPFSVARAFGWAPDAVRFKSSTDSCPHSPSNADASSTRDGHHRARRKEFIKAQRTERHAGVETRDRARETRS